MTSLAKIAASGPAASGASSRVIAFPTPRAPCEPAHPEPAFHAPSLRPADVARRQSMTWPGLCVDNVQVTRHEPFEYEFRAPFHLLIAYERASRVAGETFLDGLPRSSLRDFSRKLTFVPAGHEYREWQRPRVRSRVICFYFDPAKMPVYSGASATGAPLGARLFFENNVLWETAVKLAIAIEDGCEPERYCEALAVVVAHELMHMQGNLRRRRPPTRGSLAVWQQRIVATYIEEHLAEAISLHALAKLVDLSPYYFCRAFKQSFGIPPHRYHVNRRIERAKALLAERESSVTDVALEVGFSETSSFSAAFRHTTGTTPTEYRRTLA